MNTLSILKSQFISNKSVMCEFVMRILIAFIVIATGSCNNDPITPEEIQPGRRDYEWTIDTLPLPAGTAFIPTRLWGLTSDDVWMMGFGDAGYRIWRFNGMEWIRDTKVYSIYPSALWGSSNDNIWVASENSTIWRYDGSTWTKFSDLLLDGYPRIVLNDIYGTSANDIWGVGFAENNTKYHGVLLRFDGMRWNFINIPEVRTSFDKIRYQYKTNKYFIEALQSEPTGDTSRIYILENNSLKTIYIGQKHASIRSIEGEIYIVYNKGIYKYTNDNLELWKDFTSSPFAGVVVGRTEKDFFTYNHEEDGSWGLGHFNGIDLKTIYVLPPNYRLSGILVLKSEVFVQCFSMNSNGVIIIRGKLSTE